MSAGSQVRDRSHRQSSLDALFASQARATDHVLKKSAISCIAPKWICDGEIVMPTHLSVKNVPDEVLQRLKARAERHHRSLQGELLSILEEAVAADAILTPEEVLRRVSERALTTPSESVQMIRGDRDAR